MRGCAQARECSSALDPRWRRSGSADRNYARSPAPLMRAGKPIDVYLFPDTDHGMVEFITNADGSRTVTRITEGYLRLVGDWIHGRVAGAYGRGQKLDSR